MAAQDSPSNVRFIDVENTSWPVPVCSDYIDGPEWVQRYASDERATGQRMRVASIIAAYTHLLDPNITQADAIAMLKLARKAAKKAQEA